MAMTQITTTFAEQLGWIGAGSAPRNDVGRVGLNGSQRADVSAKAVDQCARGLGRQEAAGADVLLQLSKELGGSRVGT
jgi:hypothetical protein